MMRISQIGATRFSNKDQNVRLNIEVAVNSVKRENRSVA